MAMDTTVASTSDPTFMGLTGVLAKPLARVPVRSRASSVTASAWRLEVSCDQGPGGIVLVELSDRESCFRGDGVFLGWPKARLADAYRVLTESVRALEVDFVVPQLG